MSASQQLIFDGHNDVLLKLYRAGGVSAAVAFAQGYEGAIDAPKAKAGGFGGGFFAHFVPSETDLEFKFQEMSKDSYDLPLPDPIPQVEAMAVVKVQNDILKELETLDVLRICRSTDDIRAANAADKIAAIYHIEGAEAIDADLTVLDKLYDDGLRSLGPVWSRPTIFGHGVPFRFPSSPDTGAGLTEAGLRLIKRCDALGIMVDLSHLNEAGFWDVAKHSTRPLVATHSNAHGITPHSRNLTDKQLDAIRDSDGMVGLNFAVAFLRKDGKMKADVPLTQMLHHLDYLIERVGEDRVGLGSDYDGAVVPEAVTTVKDLPALRQAMAENGFDDALISKLCFENWMRVLDKSWGP